jgi:hypothetical protein
VSIELLRKEVSRLQANEIEYATSEKAKSRLKALLGQAVGMVNGATQEWHDEVARELKE